MSRPKPKILLEFTDKNTYRREEVLYAEATWAIFYQGKPFNLKSSNSISPVTSLPSVSKKEHGEICM